jgi:hypothetical protein
VTVVRRNDAFITERESIHKGKERISNILRKDDSADLREWIRNLERNKICYPPKERICSPPRKWICYPPRKEEAGKKREVARGRKRQEGREEKEEREGEMCRILMEEKRGSVKNRGGCFAQSGIARYM